MPWYRKLHWQIIIGLVLGAVYGVVAAANGWVGFTSDWITPFGTIFLNMLKLIAVPLVLASLITGVASLSDVRRLSRIGGKTIGIYVLTTTVAVTIGLGVVNITRPGATIPKEMQAQLQKAYEGDVESSQKLARQTQDRGPLQPIVDMVPENIFGASSENANMLQVVFVAIFFGIGLIQVSREYSEPVLDFFDGIFQVVIRLVDVIMAFAPIGVFGLMADAITSITQGGGGQIVDLLGALGFYCLAVVGALAIHALVTYSLLLWAFTDMPLSTFAKGIAPAQLVAFTTSSSGATLPVTMERCEEKLGVSDEISSFVLPLGATINMDGTALYQAVAAVFIAQTLGLGLTLGAQLTIVLTAVLASIGTAAVPSAGIIMLVVILEAVGVPSAGIALIMGVDRILDMLRTTVNITGDATIASVVAASEGMLGPPNLDETEDQLRARPEAT